MKSIGWFTTGRGPGSLGLFSMMRSKIENGEIDARLSFIFLNREVKDNKYRAKLVSMAEKDGVPIIFLPSDPFRPDLKRNDMDAWRCEYGKAMRERISKYHMDFGVLAGYMLILDSETCLRNDIINLHPALPDTYKGTWEEIVRKVVENGDEEYGSTIHICTPELDRGQTVAFDHFPLAEIRRRYNCSEELVRQVRAAEAEREAPLLMMAVKKLVDGDLNIKDGRLYDRQRTLVIGGLDLSSLVDGML